MTTIRHSDSERVALPTRRNMMLATAGALFLGGLSAMGMGSLATGRVLRPPAAPVPRTYFGMHIHHADSTTPWPNLNFGGWRLWDAYASWPQLEPRRGQWDFKRLDKYVVMAGLSGVDLLLPMGLSPGWASARPEEPSAYQPGNAAEPARIDDWRNYVRTVAERYKGRIRYYELWNEPNLSNFYTGSVEAMVRLARETHVIVKQVDPANLLVGPAATEGGKLLDWLERFLALGGGDYLDVLSHHFYVPRQAPEAMLAVMDDVRALATRYGLSTKSIWNTETGWWFDRPTTSPTFTSWKKLKPDEAIAYVSRALILGWAAGLKRFYWYSLEHGNMGLVEGDNLALNGAGKAYQRTQEWLEGAVMTSCMVNRGLWTCTLNRGGVLARIVWLETGRDIDWRCPAEWGVREWVSLDGNRNPLSLGTHGIVLSELPVLLLS